MSARASETLQERAYEEWIRDQAGSFSGAGRGNLSWLLGTSYETQAEGRGRPVPASRHPRILMVLCQRPADTGSGTVARELVDRLPGIGYDVGLLYGAYDQDHPSNLLRHPPQFWRRVVFGPGSDTDLPYPIVGMSNNMPYRACAFKDLDMEGVELYCRVWHRKLAECIAAFNPDLIHVHHLWLVASIAALSAGQIPLVVSVHGTDLRRARDCPHLAHLVRPHVKTTSQLLLLSASSKDEVCALYGAERVPAAVLWNGFDERLFYPSTPNPNTLDRYQIPFRSGVRIVLFIGKFDRPKGVEWLIRAFARIRTTGPVTDVMLVIGGAGPEPEFRRYRELVERLGIEGIVRFTGQIDHSHLRDLLNSAHVLALPAYHEPFGLVLLEALACGTRIVTTDQGGPSEFVPESLRNSEDASLLIGLESLYPTELDQNRFVGELARRIADQLSKPLRQGDRVAISASVRGLSWSAYVKKLAGVYQSILGPPTASSVVDSL